MWRTLWAAFWDSWRVLRRQSGPMLHEDGVLVGMRPGDPILPGQMQAIFDYVERHGTHIGALAPGETKIMHFKTPEREERGQGEQ